MRLQKSVLDSQSVLATALLPAVAIAPPRQRDSPTTLVVHTFGRTLRTILPLVALLGFAGGSAVASTVALSRVAVISSAGDPSDSRPEARANIRLAQAFSDATNAHDVNALVELFTEEDAGPTVTADRFAWEKFEIRLWAEEQADGNIRTEAYDDRLTEHGASWDATVHRDDWAAIGVKELEVTNSIWVYDGKIANFTSVPRNSVDVEQLGNLWRPGATPERQQASGGCLDCIRR